MARLGAQVMVSLGVCAKGSGAYRSPPDEETITTSSFKDALEKA